MRLETLYKLKEILILFTTSIVLSANIYGQDDKELVSDFERTFMPTIQMGYVNNATIQLSGGLMVQTSIEYRDISNFIFRINYDAFNSKMNVKYPINQNVSFTGKTSFSELIIGVGYRQQFKKHNLTGYVQPGLRFYGYPLFTTNGTQINLEYDTRNIGIIRYSLGYEYAITPKLFLTMEGLVGHSFKSIDFWADNRLYYGLTIGIAAPII